MACSDRTPFASNSNVKQTSDRPLARTLLEFLLPNLASGPLLDTPPHLDRPSTPLGFCTRDNVKEQEEDSGRSLESSCTQLVSEAWAGITIPQDDEKDDHWHSIACPAPRIELLPSLTKEVTESQARALRPLSRLRYHGHSQSALTDYKVFWNSRYEDWARWQIELEEVNLRAYDGIQKRTPRRTRNPVPICQMDSVGHYSGEYIPEFEAPIYPRTGSLALLHQPITLEHERLFIDFPLHKIHKIFFAHDMEHRSELDRKNKKQDSCEEDESELSFTSNEATLVEEPQGLEKLKGDEAMLPDANNPKYQEAGAWELDWNVKWELLIELIRRREEEIRAGILSDVCREYLQDSVAEDEQDEDEDENDCIVYADYSTFDELLIC
jgi:hypothetical protein